MVLNPRDKKDVRVIRTTPHWTGDFPEGEIRAAFAEWLLKFPSKRAGFDAALRLGKVRLLLGESYVSIKADLVLRLFLNLEPGETTYESATLALPPGCRLAAVLRFLLTRKAFDRYVAPTIADMQEEYVEALAAGRIWHARWIAVRGHLLVIPGWLYAFVMGKISGLLRRGG